MPLTDRQKAGLDGAILEYLRDNGYNESFQAFSKESGASLPDKNSKLLETKWKVAVRLQKKIRELEQQLEEKEADLKDALPFQFGKAAYSQDKHDAQLTLPNALQTEMKGHMKQVNAVRFHPNTSWLATASDDGRIGIWDFEEGKLVRWVKGHMDAVNALCFNHNGTRLVSASTDMSIRVWDLEDDFRCLKTLRGHDHTVTGVLFIPSVGENVIVSCSRDGSVRLWEIDSGYNTKSLMDLHDGEWIKNIAVAHDGTMLATCSVDQTVRVWDTKEFKLIHNLRGHDHVVETIMFSNANVDEIVSGHKMREDENESPKYLASGGRDKNIIIWDLNKGYPTIMLKGHANWVRDLTFHPSGNFLFSCSDDRTIRIWDLRKQRQQTVFENAHDAFIASLDWHPALSLLATAATNRNVKIWCHTDQ